MTSFVDLDPTHPGGLLGLAPGRSGASVRGWLALQSQAFRDGIEVVAIDPSAPFARALRELLPNATMVVDHWHLHRLANLMLTEVRQRVTRDQLGHRGRNADDVWAYRRCCCAQVSGSPRARSGGCITPSATTTPPARSSTPGPAAAASPARADRRRRSSL